MTTAIRLLRHLGAHHVEEHDLSSLRLLVSVGEPINTEACTWYNEHVSKRQSKIETGSIVVALFPGAIKTKPGSAIEPAILDLVSRKQGNWTARVERRFIS